VSKKKQQRRVAPSSRRWNAKRDFSWIIPIAVGVVLLIVAVGIIVASEARQPSQASASNGTALPQSTLPSPYPDVPRVTPEQAQQKLAQGQAVLVDVRNKVSYDSEHADGALSIPEAEIDARLSELPRDREIILYCT
jgi:flagellar basal body-associated protein FliL